MSPALKIAPLEIEHLPRVREFTDRAIGEGYFSIENLHEIVKKSVANGENCSFVLLDSATSPKTVLGVRLSYPPPQWQNESRLVQKLNPAKWSVPLTEVG